MVEWTVGPEEIFLQSYVLPIYFFCLKIPTLTHYAISPSIYSQISRFFRHVTGKGWSADANRVGIFQFQFGFAEILVQ